MNKEEHIRNRIISYIKQNETQKKGENFTNYSLLDLVMLKTQIELMKIKGSNIPTK